MGIPGSSGEGGGMLSAFSSETVNPILHVLFWAGLSRGDGIHHTFLTLVLFDGFELNLVQ